MEIDPAAMAEVIQNNRIRADLLETSDKVRNRDVCSFQLNQYRRFADAINQTRERLQYEISKGGDQEALLKEAEGRLHSIRTSLHEETLQYSAHMQEEQWNRDDIIFQKTHERS